MEQTKRDVRQQFGKSAESYVESKLHKDGNDLQKLIGMASISGKEELLDIATGGGHTANAFASRVHRVTALDLTKEMLAAAEKFIKGNGHQNVEFVVGDAEKLPFAEKTFDIVTCRIAPHHFPNIRAFLSEVNRVLKDNGQFLLDDNVVPEANDFDEFYNTIEKIRDYSHFRAWKKSEWMQMLEENGFEVGCWHRFEKVFSFEPWCNRMNLSDKDKEHLNSFILNASDEIKAKFAIKVENNRVVSFKGEAIVLKALKS